MILLLTIRADRLSPEMKSKNSKEPWWILVPQVMVEQVTLSGCLYGHPEFAARRKSKIIGSRRCFLPSHWPVPLWFDQTDVRDCPGAHLGKHSIGNWCRALEDHNLSQFQCCTGSYYMGVCRGQKAGGLFRFTAHITFIIQKHGFPPKMWASWWTKLNVRQSKGKARSILSSF